MKRIIEILLLLSLVAISVSSQQSTPSVTDKDWQELLTAISNEDWNVSVDLSSKYLKQMKSNDERLKRLRYIYLYAAAGKVSAGNMSFDDLGESVKEFIGKEVVLPYRPITADCRGALNFICGSKESKDKLMIAATNKTGTTIHAFEYVQLKEPFEFANHEDEAGSITGTIQTIHPNPNRSSAIVMRIYISNGVIQTQPKKQVFIGAAG